jgi:hypothetical protein
MDLQKLNVKLFVKQLNDVPLTDFIEIFHGWIQATDGIYHDVADYSHMQGGPGIVLVAREANVSIDETGGRRGLLYSQKTPLPGTNQEKLCAVFRAALDNCRRLANEPALKGKLDFRFDEAEIIVNDRLSAPNTPEFFGLLRPDLEAVAGRLFYNVGFALQHKKDSRQRLSVVIRALEPVGFDTLFANLGVQAKSC